VITKILIKSEFIVYIYVYRNAFLYDNFIMQKVLNFRTN